MNYLQQHKTYTTDYHQQQRPQTTSGNMQRKMGKFYCQLFSLASNNGFSSGSYNFMCQNWAPTADTQSTNHYNQYSRGGSSNAAVALRSNRWTATAQLNTTFSHNFQKAQEMLCIGGSGAISARRKSKDRVQTANIGGSKPIDRSIRGILGSSDIDKHHPLSTKNLIEDLDKYNPLQTHQRNSNTNVNEYLAAINKGQTREQSLRNRAASASLRNNYRPSGASGTQKENNYMPQQNMTQNSGSGALRDVTTAHTNVMQPLLDVKRNSIPSVKNLEAYLNRYPSEDRTSKPPLGGYPPVVA